MEPDFEISDVDYILSTVGNAHFSGLTFEEFWRCVSTCMETSVRINREQLDQVVLATIQLKELTNGKRNNC